jgi:predicted secreted protein
VARAGTRPLSGGAAAVAVVFACATVACGGAGGDAELQQFTREESEISVNVGERFAISLDANPSVGDDWRVVAGADAGVVELRAEKLDEDDPDAPPGSGGVEVFEFEAVGSGTSELELFNCYRCLDRTTPGPEDEPFAERLVFLVRVP